MNIVMERGIQHAPRVQGSTDGPVQMPECLISHITNTAPPFFLEADQVMNMCTE